MNARILVAAALLASSALPALAARFPSDAAKLRQEAEHVCYGDVQKLCNDAIPDEEKIKGCMQVPPRRAQPGLRQDLRPGHRRLRTGSDRHAAFPRHGPRRLRSWSAGPARGGPPRPSRLRGSARRRMILGGAMLDASGAPVGSTMLVDFPDLAAVEAWIASDPYTAGDVWRDVEVAPFRIAVERGTPT